MPTEHLLGQIASTGIVGVFCVIALIIAWTKDKALTIEKDARIADATKFAAAMASAQAAGSALADQAANLADRLEAEGAERVRLEEERDRAREIAERVEREVAMRVGGTPSQGFKPQPGFPSTLLPAMRPRHGSSPEIDERSGSFKPRRK